MNTHIDRALRSITNEINNFLKRTGISPSAFGRMALNDSHAFWLIDTMRPDRLRRVEQFITQNTESGPVTSPGGDAAQPQLTKPSCGRKAVKPALAPVHVQAGKGGERCNSKASSKRGTK